jgi:hypothetical protein
MTTKLDGTLRREIEIGGEPYTLTITPQQMTLTRKGKRKGFDLEWSALVSGEAALVTALNASLTANPAGSTRAAHTGAQAKKRKR